MPKDNTINQETCSYGQLVKTMEDFINNTMRSYLELHEHFEELAMHIKNANDFMEKIKAKKLDPTKD